MSRPLVDPLATPFQRQALARHLGTLGLELADLEAPPRPEQVSQQTYLSKDDARALRDKARALGISSAALVRGLVRSSLRG